MVRKAPLMGLHWAGDLEREREGDIRGFTRAFEQGQQQVLSPSGRTGAYVPSRVLGGVLDPVSSFTPHIQPHSTSGRLDLPNPPHVQPPPPGLHGSRLLSVTPISLGRL